MAYSDKTKPISHCDPTSTIYVISRECFFLSLGDEMGMLEDVCVSISNLTCVKFKVTCQLFYCRCISARLLLKKVGKKYTLKPRCVNPCKMLHSVEGRNVQRTYFHGV